MCSNDFMDIFTAMRTRRSIRKYQDKPVDDETLQAVLEAARIAPSAKNTQDWRFVVVRDPAMRQKMVAAANNQQFVGQAPVIIACCSAAPDYRMRCGQPAGTIDVSIAIDHMTLAAVALGLGTCWIGSFFPDQVRELLNIPEDIAVVELLTLGYPEENPAARPRKSLEEIVFNEKWEGGAV